MNKKALLQSILSLFTFFCPSLIANGKGSPLVRIAQSATIVASTVAYKHAVQESFYRSCARQQTTREYRMPLCSPTDVKNANSPPSHLNIYRGKNTRAFEAALCTASTVINIRFYTQNTVPLIMKKAREIGAYKINWWLVEQAKDEEKDEDDDENPDDLD